MRIGKRNRFVALITAAGIAGVLLTSDNPIGLWFIHDFPIVLLGWASVLGSLVVACCPTSRRWLPLVGLPVLFWVLRALDVLVDWTRGERGSAALFVFLTLAAMAYSYWSLALRYEALAGALRRDIDRDSCHGGG